MRILIVASNNKRKFAPFITEQAEALRRYGCEIEYFGIIGKGIKGYIKACPKFKAKIKSFEPDIIHAHYGLSGLLANLQRRIPVVTTYHGSDINMRSVLPFSKIAMALSKHNIFVSQKTIDIAGPHRKFSLIPCGVDLTDLQLTEKSEAREKMGLDQDRKYVLFSGAFTNTVKNYPLAKNAMQSIPEAELIELKGYSREQVTLLMCAVDVLLMTSNSEGSPQVIKEAMACGCPIVSVDVGDVTEIVSGIAGCVIAERNGTVISREIDNILLFKGKTDGRKRIIERGLDNDTVSKKLFSIYSSVL